MSILTAWRNERRHGPSPFLGSMSKPAAAPWAPLVPGRKFSEPAEFVGTVTDTPIIISRSLADRPPYHRDHAVLLSIPEKDEKQASRARTITTFCLVLSAILGLSLAAVHVVHFFGAQ